MLRSLVAVALAVTCAAPPARDAPLQLRRVFDSWSSKIEQPRTEVIRSEARWVEVWNEVSPSGAPPATDFSRETLLLAARGTQATGCNLIRIDSVARSGGDIVVTVAEINPGQTCGCIAALSHAVDVVAIPATSQNVRFEKITRVLECGGVAAAREPGNSGGMAAAHHIRSAR